MTAAPPRAMPGLPLRRAGLAVALVSAAVLAFEILLMRRLLIERWHHFGFLVISTALLGFGASGTLLALLDRHVRAAPRRTLWTAAAALLVTLTIMPRIAASLPITAQFIPTDLGAQVGWWSVYWLLALLPFLAGGVCIGAALMAAGPYVGRIYAANLVGSALGAVAAVLLASRLLVQHALWPVLACTVVALFVLSIRREKIVAGVLAILALAAPAVWPQPPNYDEHKYAAYVERLAAQGSAQLLGRAADPHGQVEIYASPLFHDLPFLSLREAPPPMLRILINGDPAGSVLEIDSPDQATVMDGTLMAVPYRLLPPQPRVLLAGETGGTNIWLARRNNAQSVIVAQPNAAVIALLRRPDIAARTGGVLSGNATYVSTTTVREILRRKVAPFHLIQLVTLESLGQGGTGTRGLAEDHLLTTEGLAECLRKLAGDGILAVSRGIQSPPRENLRLLATLAAALERTGVEQPGRHLIQVRDYLGVCTLALRKPLDDARRAALERAIRDFNLTPVWYDGLPVEQVNQPDALPGPPGTDVDWYHHAATQVLSPQRESFFDAWLLNVRPATDDRPFFWDFYKPGAIDVLREAYGPSWLSRAEIGRLFLYVSLAISGAAAVVLILLPLGVARFWQRRRSRATRLPAGGVLFAVVYFGAIGVGFMGVEMALISRAIHALGDPVMASAWVVGAILVFSGLGSLASHRLARHWAGMPATLVMIHALVMYRVAWRPLTESFLSPDGVLLIALAAVTAWFMGMPMPAGLRTLEARAPALVPWAWGINGAASVIATSAAIVLAMHVGYRVVLAAAAGLYVPAAIAITLISLRRPGRDGAEPTAARG